MMGTVKSNGVSMNERCDLARFRLTLIAARQGWEVLAPWLPCGIRKTNLSKKH
jgi:hypothetical protein